MAAVNSNPAPGIFVSNGPPQTNGRWGMGLGHFASFANLTAVGLISLMFYQGQQEFLRIMHDDRTMFREELKVLHGDSQRKWEAINANTSSTAALANLMRSLTEEVRQLKKDRPGPRSQIGPDEP